MSSGVRILLVHNYYQQRGGEDVAVEQELDLLQRKGHETQLYAVTNDDIRGLWRKAATAAFVVYNPATKTAMARKLSAFRPDIVHVHNFFPQLSPSVFDACRDAGIPCVMTLHNFRILCPTSILFHDGRVTERSLHHTALWALPHRVYRSSFLATLPLAAMVDAHKWAGTWRRKVDRFIALTAFAKAKFVEGGIPSGRIAVKGNAAPDPAAAGTQPRHGALYVGRLSGEKGIATLLAAWHGVNYPLRIAGDGPLLQICATAQSGNISCLGRLTRERVDEEMRRAAFLVLPSVCYEMFPMTLVEAFAHGLPVLASNLGGLASLVDDHATGLLFKPGDPADLRAKAEWAAEHPADMAAMGGNARAKYEARYTAEQNYANLIAIYEQAIKERQS